MPPKPMHSDKPSTDLVPDVSIPSTSSSRSRTPNPGMLATPAQPILPPPGLSASTSSTRPTLPPLSQLQSLGPGSLPPLNQNLPPAVPPFGSGKEYAPTSSFSGSRQPSQQALVGAESLGSTSLRAARSDYPPTTPVQGQTGSSSQYAHFSNTLKHNFNLSSEPATRSSFGLITPSTTQSEPSEPRNLPSPSTTNVVNTETGPHTGMLNFSVHGSQRAFSPVQSNSSSSVHSTRFSLHIRQQPRAARAGPDGKDRRPIDPPPVLQLMMTDFDPESESDLAEIRSTFWVVHCRLVSAQSPKKDLSTLASVSESGSKEIQRLLLGTAVASPFLCEDDPDIETMPIHPNTAEYPSDPPSPSSRFLLGSASTRKEPKGKDKIATSSNKAPSCFFIFADLSVRKAGEYRLEFSLMKIEASVLTSGSTLPILHSITSQVFRVVNAKDFDQVQPSTSLVKGLLDRGAGFPLKLKKGTREGQRRRGAGGRSDGGDESDEDEDDT